MRFVLLATLVLGLSGCSSIDFFGDSSDSAPAAAPPAAAGATADTGSAEQAAQAAAAQNVHCKNLAKLRAIDSAYEGEDTDTQRAVYDRTLSDCIAWNARHGS